MPSPQPISTRFVTWGQLYLADNALMNQSRHLVFATAAQREIMRVAKLAGGLATVFNVIISMTDHR